jgi:acylphosphatase
MIARRVIMSGRVQGVGFREGLVDSASAEGLAGWVRNRYDGTVEAVLQGDPAAVERIVQWCRRGPPAARVTGIDVAPMDVDPEQRDFVRKPTA